MVKAYSLKELSTEDAKLRNMAHNLCLAYNAPIHLADDFVSDAYLKVNSSYFSQHKYVTLGGMFAIIKSIILDYLKSSHTKKTIHTKEDDLIFENLEFQPTNFEIEIENNRIYESRIDAVTSLSDEDINIILLTVQTSFRVAAQSTDKTIHFLRKNKTRILTYLREQTN